MIFTIVASFEALNEFRIKELFKIAIQPEKELVMILVPADIKDRVMNALYDEAGLASAGHGIAFSLPVERTLGLSDPDKEEEK